MFSPPPDGVVLVISAIVLVFFRLHAFGLPLETDECNYAYIGSRLLAGDRLYADVWDHQPPGVFALFAAVIAVFGRSDAVFRWLAVAFSLVSLWLLHHLARRHFGSYPAAVAAMVFAVTSSDPGIAGEGCNREIYMNTLILGAFSLLARESVTRRHLVGAGALLAAASIFKTVVAAQWLLLALWTAGRRFPANRSWRPTVESIVLLGLGPAAAWLLVGAYFAWTDRWGPFMDAVFGYNLAYSHVEGGLWSRFTGFFQPVFQVFHSAQPLWNAALVGTLGLAVLCRQRWRSPAGGVLALLVGSFLAVCLPGRFFPHYYYLLLTPAILTCAGLLGHLLRSDRGTNSERRKANVEWRIANDEWRIANGEWRIAKKRFASLHSIFAILNSPLLRRRWVLSIGATVWAGILFACEWVHYGGVDPAELTAPHPAYRYRQAWSRAQGRRVAKVTDAQDTVFVWGQDAGIYYYADRTCASRYTMVGALLADTAGTDRRRRILLDELNRRRPRLVLVVEPDFPELRTFLKTYYTQAGPQAFDRNEYHPERIIMIALTDRSHPIKAVDWEWRWPK